jgi:cytochrome c-type biogenesis protein CcmH/NrfG
VLLLLVVLISSTAWGHPEIVAQIEQLDREIAAQPANASLLLKRGDLYRRDGDYAAAQQDFSAAHRLDPSLSEYDFYAGRLALEMDDASIAEKQLGLYLQSYPGNAAAWALRGQARMDLQHPIEAAADFAAAIQHSTKPTPALYLQQARAFDTAGREYQAKALEVIDQGLERFPMEVSLLGLGTDIALELKLNERARGYIDTLPEPITNLPQWQARINKLAEAESGQP